MIAVMACVCSWCDEVLRPGDMTNVSHGCCCSCKSKYFGTLTDASECQMKLLSQEHERCYQGASPKSDICHIEVLECKVCKRIESPEPYPCNCGGND